MGTNARLDTASGATLVAAAGLARALSLGLVLTAVGVTSAHARVRHNPGPIAYDRHDAMERAQIATARTRSARQVRPQTSSAAPGPAVDVGIADGLRRQLRQQAGEIEKMRQELTEIRRELRPDQPASVRPLSNRTDTAVASLGSEMPLPDTTPKQPPPARHVFPATAIQRGQHNDRRRTHRHAGIDLAGAHGSPIVASFGGRVLPSPGRDRGYGPHVIVIKGNDGIVYRYAHLSSVVVRIGQQVETGQRIGGMGRVGRRGRDHLHFEMIPWAEYRRRPYGVHTLNPNDYLGGNRGKRMVAGAAMMGQAAHRYASAH
jgi:murein DD-endopeptidase MepM/ murein hydrolase activator NlpD